MPDRKVSDGQVRTVESFANTASRRNGESPRGGLSAGCKVGVRMSNCSRVPELVMLVSLSLDANRLISSLLFLTSCGLAACGPVSDKASESAKRGPTMETLINQDLLNADGSRDGSGYCGGLPGQHGMEADIVPGYHEIPSDIHRFPWTWTTLEFRAELSGKMCTMNPG